MQAEMKKELSALANKIRISILDAVYNAKSGHPGGSLSIADILTYLYFRELKVDPQKPNDPDRDRFVLSKGHAAPGLYATLAHRGFFDIEELKKLRHLDSFLQGHPSMKSTPGVDMSTGSLGQGISAACGMALAAKLSGKNYRVYAILGDGELEEGQVWEAVMFAAQYKLDNLVAVVDNNGLQIDGKLYEVCSPEPIPDKFKAFGWKVTHINGHIFDEIEIAFEKAKTTTGAPTVIVASTIKGKGVSFMENNCGWHGKAPSAEQYEQAVNELKEAQHV